MYPSPRVKMHDLAACWGFQRAIGISSRSRHRQSAPGTQEHLQQSSTMSLRTFANNPSLGGFGNETSSVSNSSNRKSSKPSNSRKRSRQIPSVSQAHRTVSAAAAAAAASTNESQTEDRHMPMDTDGIQSCNHNDDLACDAFAQIIKELVDNAVDACSMDSTTINLPNQPDIPGNVYNYKRVRVAIQVSENDDSGSTESQDPAGQRSNALRVTVSDNGCGIENIDECVNAFRSTKNDSSNDSMLTAGRYGMGLTLCLLHAQRLVPHSYASITSATESARSWTKVSIVVDADNDKVSCSNRKNIPKKMGEERSSGTAVSLLLPGGMAAKRAWPRLAEYLARYQLSLDLKCSIDIIAPSLSPIPLSIRPQLERERSVPFDDNGDHTHSQKPRSPAQSDQGELLSEQDLFDSMGLPDIDDLILDSQDDDASGIDDQIGEMKRVDRMKIAVSKYLNKDVSSLNISSHSHPIRRMNHENPPNDGRLRPSLELFMIVYDKEVEIGYEVDSNTDKSKARAVLIRFFNHIPLLDSPEVSACGLYHAMIKSKTVWNSFGVDLKQSQDNTCKDQSKPKNNKSVQTASDSSFVERYTAIYRNLHMPTFELCDTTHIVNHLKENASAHGLFQAAKNNDSDDSGARVVDSERDIQRNDILLPIGARFGNVLVVAYLNANLQDVSFPSLSKGRLPMNDHGISEAFEICLSQCLEKLQWKNPALFPSPSILRKEQRDNRYIPLISSALALICDRSSRREMGQTVLSWSESVDIAQVPSQTVDILTETIRNRIRDILTLKENESGKVKSRANRGKASTIRAGEVSDDESADVQSISSSKSMSHLIGTSDLNSSESPHEKENDGIIDECLNDILHDEKVSVQPFLSLTEENRKSQSLSILSVASPHSALHNADDFVVYEEW